MVQVLSVEERALAEWLEHSTPIKRLEANYGVRDLEIKFQGYFRRFVDAASAYQYDECGELSHRRAAQEQGLDVWVYELMMSKFGVDHEPSEEGRRRVIELKGKPLYHLC